MVRAAGCIKRSTDVMTAMNKLVKIPELQKTMLEMAREMERAGLIEETIGDALGVLDGDEVETETENEVNKVVAELTGDLFKDTAATPTALPQTAVPAQPEAQQETPVEEDAAPGDLDAMKARLQAL